MIRDAGRMASEAQKKRVLFDLREARYKGYYSETIAHANEAPSLGVDRNFRVALLGDSDHEGMLRFMEDAAVNRGFLVKAFLDEAQAVAWVGAAAK